MASISHQWCELEASANDNQRCIKPAAARGGVLTSLLCGDDEGAGLNSLFSSQTFLKKSPFCLLKYTLNNSIIVLVANKRINECILLTT